jgi:hypothetical protein
MATEEVFQRFSTPPHPPFGLLRRGEGL